MNKEEQTRGSPTGTPQGFLWVFVRGRKPSQIISTLEALAVLLSMKLAKQGNHPSHTDKLMTTRYPSSALVMELAADVKKNRVKATVEWTPREFNREADALANGDSSQFSPERRAT